MTTIHDVDKEISNDDKEKSNDDKDNYDDDKEESDDDRQFVQVVRTDERSACYCPRPWNWPLLCLLFLSPTLYFASSCLCISHFIAFSPFVVPSYPCFDLWIYLILPLISSVSYKLWDFQSELVPNIFRTLFSNICGLSFFLTCSHCSFGNYFYSLLSIHPLLPWNNCGTYWSIFPATNQAQLVALYQANLIFVSHLIYFSEFSVFSATTLV